MSSENCRQIFRNRSLITDNEHLFAEITRAKGAGYFFVRTEICERFMSLFYCTVLKIKEMLIPFFSSNSAFFPTSNKQN